MVTKKKKKEKVFFFFFFFKDQFRNTDQGICRWVQDCTFVEEMFESFESIRVGTQVYSGVTSIVNKYLGSKYWFWFMSSMRLRAWVLSFT